MNWNLTRGPVTANAEPVSLTTAKLHLKVEHDADDALITTHIVTARQECEDFTNRILVPGPFTLKLDGLPQDGIRIPVGIANLTVNAITYVNTSGDTTTLDANDYVVLQRQNACPEIVPGWDVTFPTTRAQKDAVTVTFTAGASAVDAKLVAGMLLLIGHLYEHREPAAAVRRAYESLWSSLTVF